MIEVRRARVSHPFVDLGVLPFKDERLRKARLRSYLDACSCDAHMTRPETGVRRSDRTNEHLLVLKLHDEGVDPHVALVHRLVRAQQGVLAHLDT